MAHIIKFAFHGPTTLLKDYLLYRLSNRLGKKRDLIKSVVLHFPLHVIMQLVLLRELMDMDHLEIG